jgi:hypothetical protein
VNDVLEKIEKAMGHVFELCDGTAKWTMRVPVDEDRDSDCIIMDALDSAEKALKQASRENQQEYQKHEFCRDTECPDLLNVGTERETCLIGDNYPVCCRTAKHFHDWLKENGYRIVRD